MSASTISITIKLPWWHRLYIDGLRTMCDLFGYVPSDEDIERWARFIIDHSKAVKS